MTGVQLTIDRSAVHQDMLAAVDRDREAILSVADAIHANPELAIEERFAVGLPTESDASSRRHSSRSREIRVQRATVGCQGGSNTHGSLFVP